MHVGRGVFFQNLDETRPDSDVYATELELARDVERLGFDSVWFAEHHFSGYHMCPSPLQLLTYFAGITKHIRLGTMVIVLPWHEPVRVIEDLAVLDHLSGGRVVVGMGRGLGRIEFEGFRLDQGNSRDTFAEYAATMISAFDTGRIENSGRHLNQPPVDLRPRPVASLRGRAYASAVSPDSIELIARLGLGIMVIAQKPWATTIAEVEQYRQRFIELNGEAPPKPILLSFVNVHETESGASEMHEKYTVAYAQSSLRHYEFDNRKLADIPGYEYYGRLADTIEEKGKDTFVRFLADLQIHGTPAQVTEQLVENVRKLDGAGVITVPSFGGMPADVAAANQRLLVNEVLPELKAIDPDRGLAAVRPGVLART
jgi:alkanesulfonate monooxygenase SsuD/methylene tetrahydromethanopterin reductase-like flavin-dependent oxidoreductase (luciferase family)